MTLAEIRARGAAAFAALRFPTPAKTRYLLQVNGDVQPFVFNTFTEAFNSGVDALGDYNASLLHEMFLMDGEITFSRTIPIPPTACKVV